MSFESAPYPEIKIYPGDVPISWLVTIRRDGTALDVSNSTDAAASAATTPATGLPEPACS
jgi:hypothetical protein